MSIKDFVKKIKPHWHSRAVPLFSQIRNGLNIKEDVFIVLVIILVGLAGFGLGKLSALEKSRSEVKIRKTNFMSSASITNIPTSASAMIASENAQGLLVASKTGQKYHFPWCAGASQIAEKNKIWFDSYEEAQKAGYTPASNCKGLK